MKRGWRVLGDVLAWALTLGACVVLLLLFVLAVVSFNKTRG
jgi:hypothetical protein